MDDKTATITVLAIAIAMLVFCGMYIGYDQGKIAGHIQVASDQYECILEEQDDRTTEWKCEEMR